MPLSLNRNDVAEVINYGSACDQLMTLDNIADIMAEHKLFDVDSLAEKLTEGVEALEKVEDMEKDLQQHEEFFSDVIGMWQETLADGAWPCAEPWDNNLRQAIYDDLDNAKGALYAIEEFAAQADGMDADELRDWIKDMNRRFNRQS